MIFIEFPKWKYHVSLPAVIVQDPSEEEALGPGWHNNPGEATRAAEAQPTPRKKKK